MADQRELKVTTSAPGKMILFGEHAVVYGVPAIAVTLSQRFWVSFEAANEGQKVWLELSDLDLSLSWDIQAIKDLLPAMERPSQSADAEKAKPAFIASRLETLRSAGLLAPSDHQSASGFLYLLVSFLVEICTPEEGDALLGNGLFCRMKSQLPIGAGLGSSAAFSVSTVHAFFVLLDRLRHPAVADRIFERPREQELRTINEWAFVIETLIHGTPSGIDNTCSTYGGALQYERGKDWQILDQVPQLRFLITNTKVPKSTKALVAGVRERWLADPDTFNPMFTAVGQISAACRELFAEAHASSEHVHKRMHQLVLENQEYLRRFGVSHESIEKIVALSETFGFASKLTGAGGGGCVITLLPSDAQAEDFIAAIGEQGLGECFETQIGGGGTCLHDGLPAIEALEK